MTDLQLTIRGDSDEMARLREILTREGFLIGAETTTSPSVICRTPGDENGGDERARRIEELDAALRELRNLDVAKSQFLANVSHELRTPLTAIVTYGEVLRDGLLGDVNERQKEAVQSVITSSRQLLTMIEEILTYARTNARAIELEPAQFAVGNVVDMVHEMSASLMRKKEIRFERAIEEGLPLAHADRDKIIHVLTNLIGNAIEFTPPGGLIRVAAKRWKEEPTWLCMAVEDSGIGIDPEHHEMIFREFAQVDSSRSRQHHGTGLGLAIARNFIQLHGGEIGVVSELGQGSRFYFTGPSVEAVAVSSGRE
ncbi:MAG TPA: ATP-binding protein [Longimicrobiaceae bacterium]|nr:ATP-binding protein [Longimicrobiaceae bacterium]